MKHQRWLVFVGLFLLLLYVYRGPLADVLVYHEQHHLFLYTAGYFHHALAADGLASYLTDFLIQFFYHPLLGAALMALLLSLVYGLSEYLLALLFGRQAPLHPGIIPALLLLLHTETTAHTLVPVTTTVIALTAACLVALLLRRLTPWLPLIKKEFHCRRKVRILISAASLALYLIGGYTLFLRHYNPKEGILLKTEHYAQRGAWSQVLDYTGRYLMTGKSNQFISYFHNMALYHLGQLPYHQFDYPQALGVKSIYFPWESNSRESEYGHYLYEQLGLLNEAHRWEFEAMVAWGETAPHLTNLARYNIAIGRPAIARMYINKLRQSLFYRSLADSLDAIRYRGRVPGLHHAMRGVTDHPARFTNVRNIGPELENILRHDPKNRMAFEYLMSQLLLSNHLVRFAENLPRIRQFGHSTLPPVYEEALLVYKTGVSEADFARCGFAVSPATEARFAQYVSLMKQGDMQALQARFGNTYWFYLHYISPYGNKVINDRPSETAKGVTQL